jgi:hypothetical protein
MTDPIVGYPHLMSIKEDLRKVHGINRMGSADSSYKKLLFIATMPWMDGGLGPLSLMISRDQRGRFIGEAAKAMVWLIESSAGAWSYSAQSREIKYPGPGGHGFIIQRKIEFRHHVKFELQSDAMLFKLSH